jgi:hypothetical protein
MPTDATTRTTKETAATRYRLPNFMPEILPHLKNKMLNFFNKNFILQIFLGLSSIRFNLSDAMDKL